MVERALDFAVSRFPGTDPGLLDFFSVLAFIRLTCFPPFTSQCLSVFAASPPRRPCYLLLVCLL
jgi:hypothetical protein